MSLTSCHIGSYFLCFLSNSSVFWFPLQFFLLPSGVDGTAYISHLGLFQNTCSPSKMDQIGTSLVAFHSVYTMNREDWDEIHYIAHKTEELLSGLKHESCTLARLWRQHPSRVCIPWWLSTHSNWVGGQSVKVLMEPDPPLLLSHFLVEQKRFSGRNLNFQTAKVTPECNRVAL